MPVVSLIFTILLCPLAAFALFGLSALLGKRFPRQDLISTAAILAALVCSLQKSFRLLRKFQKLSFLRL